MVTHEAKDWQKIFIWQNYSTTVNAFLVVKKINDPSSSYCILVVLPLQTYNTALSKTTPAHVQGLCVLHSQPARTRFTSIRRSSVIFGIKVLPISASAPFRIVHHHHSNTKKCHVNFLSPPQTGALPSKDSPQKEL